MLILCVIVFFSRIIDVSLGTIRTIMTVRGNRIVAAVIGFIEVLIWFLIVRKAISTDQTSIFIAVSFAAGYAAGTFIGGLVVKLLLPSNYLVQIITSSRDDMLLKAIGDSGFSMTVSDVFGRDHKSEKYMLFIYVDGKYLDKLKKTVISYDKAAFISVSEGKASFNGQIVPLDKK